ncbi:MAG: acetyl-CoA carboxylase biotin carboxyl carrier protein [Pseudomonadota bacterium]
MAVKKSGFDSSLVKDLAKILNETDLTEIEIEQGEMRVRVSRTPAAQVVQAAAPAAAPAVAAPTAVPSAPAATAPSAAASSGNEVPSPMVGTVYFSPAPGEPTFVQVGTDVKEGETLLIIEAMKVMNQIPAPRSGTLTAFLIEDGDAVEFGQPIAVIE